MKKITFITAVMGMLLLAGHARGGICEIVNGSFEDDGVIDDITAEDPNGWDVNLPGPGKFGGYVKTEWPTDGGFNLTLYSVYYGSFDVNDMAMVSQEVCLTGVNEIVFDLKLETYYGDPWDPNKCSAVLLIDDDVVWESNSIGTDVRDEYPNRICDVSDYNGLHKLSLALRVNVAGKITDYYKAHWDFIEFDPNCGRFGFLPGDFNRDCYVDFPDFAMLANYWLEEAAPGEYDLVEDGIIDERDLKVFADNWLGSSYE